MSQEDTNDLQFKLLTSGHFSGSYVPGDEAYSDVSALDVIVKLVDSNSWK